jgi:Family of unknown function (DUF5677)
MTNLRHGARAGYESILSDLLPLYPSLISKRPGIRDGYRQVGHLAHGWYVRCHRGIESILILDREGYAVEAAPIRRAVIEHVVALKWLAAEGDVIIDTVARGHAEDTRKRNEALSAAAWRSVDAAGLAHIIRDIDPDSRDKANDFLLHFAQRCAKYADVHTVPGYLAECGQTHPGYESAVAYVELPEGSLLWTPKNEIWQVPFCTTELLHALGAVQPIFDPPPWETELTEILQRYLDVTDAVRQEDGLPPVDWSTGKVVESEL